MVRCFNGSIRAGVDLMAGCDIFPSGGHLAFSFFKEKV